MSFNKISAPIIFIGNGQVLQNQVVVFDAQGVIHSVEDVTLHDRSEINFLPYAICPGFVNTHCHLELSHMKGLVNTGTTLIPFISSVVKYRDFLQEIIIDAIEKADAEMYKAGIVAVGDISNKIDTLETKVKSKINYYTFVEMFDLINPSWTPSTIDQYKKVFDDFRSSEKNKKSLVPHAPYSVTPELFKYINSKNSNESTISIHNQETLAENELFLTKSGEFVDFYKGFGNELKEFSPIARTSIHYAMKYMDPNQKTLFVHNTQTSVEDIEAAQNWNKNIYWATCPNANLYIENRLPNYGNFINTNQTMTIGTDSLTSNWQLSIWEEIKTIAKYCSYVPVDQIIQWATFNGAEALGYDNIFGTIEKGKKPGLLSIPVVEVNNKFAILDGKCKRIDI